MAVVDAASHSSSELLTRLLDGPVVTGKALDAHQLRFDEYVVTLTPPGTSRMPNGVECRVRVAPTARVTIGVGRLTVGRFEIRPGPAWDPVPVFGSIDSLPPGPQPVSATTASWLPVSPRDAEALMAGYVAGLFLLHKQHAKAQDIASQAMARAGLQGATLLRHAARGEVPEAVHDLLITGSAGRLVAFDMSGVQWLRGLVSAGLPFEPISARIASSPRRGVPTLT